MESEILEFNLPSRFSLPLVTQKPAGISTGEDWYVCTPLLVPTTPLSSSRFWLSHQPSRISPSPRRSSLPHSLSVVSSDSENGAETFELALEHSLNPSEFRSFSFQAVSTSNCYSNPIHFLKLQIVLPDPLNQKGICFSEFTVCPSPLAFTISCCTNAQLACTLTGGTSSTADIWISGAMPIVTGSWLCPTCCFAFLIPLLLEVVINYAFLSYGKLLKERSMFQLGSSFNPLHSVGNQKY